MIIEDYVGSFDARMEKLNLLILGRRNLILVGSSFGGLMAATYACRNPENVSRLILLAPALNLEEFTGCVASKLKMPAIIFHGRSDDVVPLLPVLKIAEEVFMDLDFHVLDDDHPLSRSFESLGWSVYCNKRNFCLIIARPSLIPFILFLFLPEHGLSKAQGLFPFIDKFFNLQFRPDDSTFHAIVESAFRFIVLESERDQENNQYGNNHCLNKALQEINDNCGNNEYQ